MVENYPKNSLKICEIFDTITTEDHVKDSHCYYYDLTQMINYNILLQKYC